MNTVRTCVACRKKGSKEEFIKVIFNKNKQIFIADNLHHDGRGAYICKSRDCLLKCYKTKALNKVFKSPISEEFYKELIEKFGN